MFNYTDHQLISAIIDQNLENLKRLITWNVDLRTIKDRRGDNVLHIALRTKNVQIVDYLLSLKEVGINDRDTIGRSPIVKAATFPTPEILKLLIKNGADVNSRAAHGDTPLHQAVYFERKENCLLLLKNGANINAQNNKGLTVVQLACKTHSEEELLAMLLFCGADPNLTSNFAFTAFEICAMRNKCNFLNLLLPFVFDGRCAFPMRLEALVSAMFYNNDLFDLMVENVSEVVFDQKALEDFLHKILYCNSEYLKIFFLKFDYVLTAVQAMDDFVINRTISSHSLEHVIPNLSLIYSDLYFRFFVDVINRNCNKFILPACFDLKDIIFQAISFGYKLKDYIVDVFFDCYGDCERFRMLLHMNIEITYENNLERLLFPSIIYDVGLKEVDWIVQSMVALRKYEALEKVAEFFCITRFLSKSENVLEKLSRGPQIPSLLELSRNSARNYITDFYNLTNSAMFYTVLKELPIECVYKDIIGFRRKIYRIN